MGFKDEAPGAAAGGKKGMAAVVGAQIGAEIAPAEMNKVVPVVEKILLVDLPERLVLLMEKGWSAWLLPILKGR